MNVRNIRKFRIGWCVAFFEFIEIATVTLLSINTLKRLEALQIIASRLSDFAPILT